MPRSAIARRGEGAHRALVTEEQRRQAGCPARDSGRAFQRRDTSQPVRSAPTYPASSPLGSLTRFRRDPLDLLMSGFRELGDVVHFRLFTRDLVLVAHPNDVRWVLQEHTSNYNKRTRGFEVLRAFLRQGLLTSEGDHWLRQRRIAQPAFHRTRIAGFGDAMTQAAGELVDRWLCGSAPAVVDVTAAMMRLTLRIVGEALLSTDVSHEADRVGQALNITLRRANAAIYQIVPLPGWWPTPARRRLRAAMRTLDDVIFEIIAERRASDSEPDDLLSMLMRARDEDTGEGMSDAQLRDEVMTVFLAGQETTALALGWTWYLLSRHAAVRQRLQTEIDTVLGGRTPTVADLPRLGYVERVVKESMRLYPPAWVISRCAIEDDIIGGCRIPAGSIVLLSPYVTHRHPRFWANPEDFDPDRFETSRQAERPPFAYFPFGGGPRQCIGNSFAMMELVLVVTTIAQRCRLDLLPGEPVGTSPSITLRAATPITMHVSPRAPAPV
ncbi:MAG: cytochrome P450 [Acidobacteria bacterium]|nr:cytochrome P450 [Acidobacteriota bacterium]